MSQFKPIRKNDINNSAATTSQIQKQTEAVDPFPFVFEMNGKTYHFRKWKVKDLKAYKNLGSDTGLYDENEARKILVYNVIKEQEFLDINEYLYALIMIREASISDKLTYNFKCAECGKEYEYTADFSKICKLSNNAYGDIHLSKNVITFARLADCSASAREYFELELVNPEQTDFAFVDMVCHVKTIDGQVMNTTEIIDLFDNLYIDDFEKLLIEYATMKSSIGFTSSVECPHCHNKVEMLFDQLPAFIPDDFKNPLAEK